MISEIVRSRANVDAGAVDHRANFFHGLFLFCFVVFAPTLLGLIPLAALAAMLVATGLRLAAPSQLRHAREKGLDQLLIFLTTMIVTVVEDLLVGVAAGLALKVVLHVVEELPFVASCVTRSRSGERETRWSSPSPAPRRS